MKVLAERDRIEALGASAVFVVHDPPEAIRSSMLSGVEVPYPLLVDLERRAYREWGLGRVPFARIYLDPRVWWRYARLLLGGEPWRPGGRDTLQMGGDFVLGPDGTVAYARPQQVDDRPPVKLLIRELERVSENS